MSKERFESLMRDVAAAIGARPIDDALAADLNARFPADGDTFKAIEAACHDGIEAGWLCHHDNAGVRYSRPVKPGPDMAGLSVDVVKMKNLDGPYHRHPNGEICMVMPVTPGAKFDGNGRGWCCYPPGSAHYPAVSEGEAVVIYLLPDGAIEFTKP